ncbi:hypothetical protein LTR94_026734, partial [Friedmanniomyces endolithicus]
MTPLRLLAEDADDLQIISAALQDAIMRPVDIRWEKEARRLTVVLSRFCWECGGTRVMAAMQFGDVQAVKSRRLPRLPEAALELLALDFLPTEAPGGQVMMMFAGGGDLRIDVECLDAVLTDLSERWPARIDNASLPAATAEIEHQRRVAIFDLVEQNSFIPDGAAGGPYTLALSSQDNRLAFDIAGPDFSRTHVLSLTPMKTVIRDYGLICESYYEALR